MTLLELMISSVLLLALFGLVIPPLVMTNNAYTNGQAKVDALQQVVGPVEGMIETIRDGYQAEVTPLSGTSNTLTIYMDNAMDTQQVVFGYSASRQQVMKTMNVYNAGSGTWTPGHPYYMGQNIGQVTFTPFYETENTPGQLVAYNLPVPDSLGTPVALPDTSQRLQAGSLLEIEVVTIAQPNAPSINFSTSVNLRN